VFLLSSPDGISGGTLTVKRPWREHVFLTLTPRLLREGDTIMAVWMAGVDHTKANLDVRSVFSFTKKKTEQFYSTLRDRKDIEGCVLISTCNRMEVWFSTSPQASFSPVELLCDHIGVSMETYAPYFVERKDTDAVRHLFRLAAGMESVIIGEDQVITQVGDALSYARSCYATDHTLEVLFRQAVTAAKRVKTEANISSRDQSVVHTALRCLSEEGVSVRGRKCMVIGNGMMGRISALALMDSGADVTCTVRQYRSGVVDIPLGVRRINYDQRLEYLPSCDFVVSATSSPNYTLKLSELEPLAVGHPVRLIDLAVPRDIDPKAAGLEWAILYDIDSFSIDRESAQLRRALREAQKILDEEEKRFYNWLEGSDYMPRIRMIKEAAGSDAAARMTPALRRGELDEERRQILIKEAAGATERMVNRLLHGMRGRLDEETFRACLDAMENILCENNAPFSGADGKH